MRPIMPLGDGRLGLLQTPGGPYEESAVFSALYFEHGELCIVLDAPVTLRLQLTADAPLHDSFLYRLRCTIYEALCAGATKEAQSPLGPSAFAHEIADLTFTPKNRPRCGERWMSPLVFEAESRDAPGCAIYKIQAYNHVAFDVIVGIVEQTRRSRRPVRLFDPRSKSSVDFAVDWVPGAAAPSFLHAAGLSHPGGQGHAAFVPRAGTGQARYAFGKISFGTKEAEVRRLVQPFLYHVADGACILHLAMKRNPSATEGKSGSSSSTARKPKRDADEAALNKDRRQKRLTTYFAPQPKKARTDETDL